MVASLIRGAARPAGRCAAIGHHASRAMIGTANTTFIRTKATLPDLKCTQERISVRLAVLTELR